MLLYLIRHGDPDYANDSLTPLGRRQAEAVSRRLALSGIDRVFSSSMGRALETAQPTCELLKKECVPLDWAREISARTTLPDGVDKSLAYLPNIYTRCRPECDLDYDRSLECRGFRGSGLEEGCACVIDGARAWLETLGYAEDPETGLFRITQPNEERIALFCHGNMARTLLSYLLHVPVHIMWSSFSYPVTGVSVVHFASREEGVTAPRCLSFCDLSHLYGERLPMQHNTIIL